MALKIIKDRPKDIKHQKKNRAYLRSERNQASQLKNPSTS